MKKCTMNTVKRVVTDKIADIGKYRYILADNCGTVSIKRREISRLNTLARYDSGWDVVARYNSDSDEWIIEG